MLCPRCKTPMEPLRATKLGQCGGAGVDAVKFVCPACPERTVSKVPVAALWQPAEAPERSAWP